MTIGIYLLKFNNSNKVYIGKSINVEERYAAHIKSMVNNRATKKLQNNYNIYGKPLVEVLEVCCEEDLDELEEYYITKYNSIENGLNIAATFKSSITKRCEPTISSKLTEVEYITIFMALLNEEKSYTEISNETGLPYSTVTSIGSLNTHKWLNTRFPEEYKKLEYIKENNLRKKEQTSKLQKEVYLVDPLGDVHIVKCLRRLAEKYELNTSCLSALAKGKIKSHRGWTLYKDIIK